MEDPIYYKTHIEKDKITFSFRDEDILTADLDFIEIYECADSLRWTDEFYKLIDFVKEDMELIKLEYEDDYGITIWSDWYWSVSTELRRKRDNEREFGRTGYTNLYCINNEVEFPFRYDSEFKHLTEVKLTESRRLCEVTEEDKIKKKELKYFKNAPVFAFKAERVSEFFPIVEYLKKKDICDFCLYTNEKYQYILDLLEKQNKEFKNSFIYDIPEKYIGKAHVIASSLELKIFRRFAVTNDTFILTENVLDILEEQAEAIGYQRVLSPKEVEEYNRIYEELI